MLKPHSENRKQIPTCIAEKVSKFVLPRPTVAQFSCFLFFFLDSSSSMKVGLNKRYNSSLVQQQNGILILHLIPGKNRIHLQGWGSAWLASLGWLWPSFPILLWKRWCCSLNVYKLQSCRAPLCPKIICNTFSSRFGKRSSHFRRVVLMSWREGD